MVVKSADTKRPQSLPSTKIDLPRPTALQAAKLKTAEPSSGFAGAKKKPFNITGRLKPVAVKGNPELAAALSGQLRVAQSGVVATSGTTARAPTIDAGIKSVYGKLSATSAEDDGAAAFKAIDTAISKGDYATAAKLAETALGTTAYEDTLEEVYGPSGLNKTELRENLQSQLNFLAKMQAAKVKADYPPSKDQLVAYFKTLSDKPAAARDALGEFNEAFQVHVANETGKAGADVRYHGTEKSPLPPSDWADVEKNLPNAEGLHVGKRVNDCEGYAFIAEELMKAAGFELKHHLTANGGPAGAHAMAVFTHQKDPGNVTLTSNGTVHRGKDEKKVANEGFKAAGGVVTANNAYYAGATMTASQKNAGARSNPI